MGRMIESSGLLSNGAILFESQIDLLGHLEELLVRRWKGKKLELSSYDIEESS